MGTTTAMKVPLSTIGAVSCLNPDVSCSYLDQAAKFIRMKKSITPSL